MTLFVRLAMIVAALAGAARLPAAPPPLRIQALIDNARPGDVIDVPPGTYAESLRTVRGGAPGRPITIRARDGRPSVVVTAPGRVLTVSHPHVVVEGLVLDGQYGPSDLLAVGTRADFFLLRSSELRRSARDAIDIAAPADVTIERSLIHHALNSAGGRTDAHGIAAGAVRRLTVRDTEIHTFSGDAIQVDPGRTVPGWTDVTIERCRLWLAPLTEAANGFAAGSVPGENAIDTKASPEAARARLFIRDTVATGFRGGSISNMAAFNLKEHITAVVDRVTVTSSDIAFRLRGPGRGRKGADVIVQNAVVHDVGVAFRYEDDIDPLRIANVTIGANVARPFQSAASSARGLEVRNLLVLAPRLPDEASHPSNLSVSAAAFIDVAAGNYRLSASSPALDRGVTLPPVALDREGVKRPQGKRYDVGAFERRVGPVTR